MFRRAALLLVSLAILFFCFPVVPAKADTAPYITFSLNTGEAAASGLVKLQVQARDAAMPAAGFRIRVTYDKNVLSFAGTETTSKIQSGTLETNPLANPVCCVYVCNPDKGYAPALSGTVFSLDFQVNANAARQGTSLLAQADEICDFGGDPLDGDTSQSLALQVNAAPSDMAYLTALVPSAGRLDPPFSEDEQEYDLKVGNQVSSVTFDANAGENGSVKVNRKTLHAAGSDTLIVITVTSEDQSESSQYQVTVHRAAAPESSRASTAAGNVGSAASRPNSPPRSPKPSTVSEPKGETSGHSVNPARGAGKQGGSTWTLPSGGTNPVQAAVPPSQAQQSVSYVPREQSAGPTPVTIIGNQMPPFLTGLLAAGFLVLIGVVLNNWLSQKPKQP